MKRAHLEHSSSGNIFSEKQEYEQGQFWKGNFEMTIVTSTIISKQNYAKWKTENEWYEKNDGKINFWTIEKKTD